MMLGSSKRGGGGPGGSYTMSPVLRTWNCIRSTLSTSAVVSAYTGTVRAGSHDMIITRFSEIITSQRKPK